MKIKLKLYSIKDELSGYAAPIPFQEENMAIRWFREKLRDGGMMEHNKEDFSLWYMGEFDLNEGQIEAPKTPILVERGKANG